LKISFGMQDTPRKLKVAGNCPSATTTLPSLTSFISLSLSRSLSLSLSLSHTHTHTFIRSHYFHFLHSQTLPSLSAEIKNPPKTYFWHGWWRHKKLDAKKVKNVLYNYQILNSFFTVIINYAYHLYKKLLWMLLKELNCKYVCCRKKSFSICLSEWVFYSVKQ